MNMFKTIHRPILTCSRRHNSSVSNQSCYRFIIIVILFRFFRVPLFTKVWLIRRQSITYHLLSKLIQLVVFVTAFYCLQGSKNESSILGHRCWSELFKNISEGLRPWEVQFKKAEKARGKNDAGGILGLLHRNEFWNELWHRKRMHGLY